MAGQRILMIDDEGGFAEIVQARLQANGYEVDVATSGEEGLEKAFGKSAPELVLLDIYMPGMDGFEVLRCLRERDSTREVPVVMLTARGDFEAVFQAAGEDANDYLIKPCEPSEMLRVIRENLAGRHSDRPAHSPAT